MSVRNRRSECRRGTGGTDRGAYDYSQRTVQEQALRYLSVIEYHPSVMNANAGDRKFYRGYRHGPGAHFEAGQTYFLSDGHQTWR